MYMGIIWGHCPNPPCFVHYDDDDETCVVCELQLRGNALQIDERVHIRSFEVGSVQ